MQGNLALEIIIGFLSLWWLLVGVMTLCIKEDLVDRVVEAQKTTTRLFVVTNLVYILTMTLYIGCTVFYYNFRWLFVIMGLILILCMLIDIYLSYKRKTAESYVNLEHKTVHIYWGKINALITCTVSVITLVSLIISLIN